MRRAGGVLIIIGSAIFAFFVGTNLWVVRSTRDQVVKNAEQLPSYNSVLVLGTSNRMRGGKPNPFFNNRMDKAAELYSHKDNLKFILSGDNRTASYNEPEMMRQALIERGVAPGVLIADKAGYRTFDSVIRSREVFNASSLIIITQSFHAYRALFICNQLGISSVALAAQEPSDDAGVQVYIREYFARTRAVFDVFFYQFIH